MAGYEPVGIVGGDFNLCQYVVHAKYGVVKDACGVFYRRILHGKA